MRVNSYGPDNKTDISGSPLNVIATATPLIATSIELVSGLGQSALIEEELSGPIEVLIKDQHGNPLGGAEASF